MAQLLRKRSITLTGVGDERIVLKRIRKLSHSRAL
jgi:hypothetical protein